MQKRIQVLATTLRARPIEYKAQLVRRFVEHVLPRMGRSLFHVIDREFFGLEKAQEAHEYMESNANAGKIILHVA